MAIKIKFSVAGILFCDLDNAQVFRLAVESLSGYAPDDEFPEREQGHYAGAILTGYRLRFGLDDSETPDAVLYAKRAADAKVKPVPAKKAPSKKASSNAAVKVPQDWI